MICICCQTVEARPYDEFCSDECEEIYAQGRSRRICKTCGGWFNRAPKSQNAVCPKCRYVAVQPRKKQRKTGADGIKGVLEEQRRIRETTGRYVSYGTLMAKKHG